MVSGWLAVRACGLPGFSHYTAWLWAHPLRSRPSANTSPGFILQPEVGQAEVLAQSLLALLNHSADGTEHAGQDTQTDGDEDHREVHGDGFGGVRVLQVAIVDDVVAKADSRDADKCEVDAFNERPVVRVRREYGTEYDHSNQEQARRHSAL